MKSIGTIRRSINLSYLVIKNSTFLNEMLSRNSTTTIKLNWTPRDLLFPPIFPQLNYGRKKFILRGWEWGVSSWVTKKTKLSKFLFLKVYHWFAKCSKNFIWFAAARTNSFQKTKIKRDKEIFGHLFVVNKLPAWRSILERIWLVHVSVPIFFHVLSHERLGETEVR